MILFHQYITDLNKAFYKNSDIVYIIIMHQKVKSELWYVVYVIGTLGIHRDKPMSAFFSLIKSESEKKCNEVLKSGSCSFIKEEYLPRPHIY